MEGADLSEFPQVASVVSLDNIDGIAWDSIKADLVRKLAKRWPKFDLDSVKSAVNLAYAMVGAMIDAGAILTNPKGMMWTIAYRSLYTESKSLHPKEEVITDCNLIDDGNEISDLTPENQLIWKLRFAALKTAVANLPEYQSVPFLRALMDGVSHKDIAAELGVAVGTVANRITKARKAVIAEMEQQGFSMSGID